jgi:hypothetical protein
MTDKNNDFLDSLPTYHQERKVIINKTITGRVSRIETTVVVRDDKNKKSEK